MSKYKPLLLALAGCSLLSGCLPPVQQTPAMQPVLRIGHAGNRAAEWNQLARYHHERGQLNLALGAYAQSLALDAQQLEARNAVAVIEAQQGNLDAARKALLALVADYPGEAQPHTNLGYVYFLQGDHAAARAVLTRAMALGGGARAFENLQLAENAERLALAAKQEQVSPGSSASAAAGGGADGATGGAADVAGATAGAAVRATADADTGTATITASAADERWAPAVSIPEPAQIASRMELVQLTPHMFELKARQPAAAPARVPAAVSAPVPAAAPAAAALLTAAMARAPSASAMPAAAGPQAVAASATRAAPARLEVANGNGISGMAKRFRSLLGQMGIPVDRISNDRPFRQEITTIQYSPGFEQHAASLQKALQGKVQLASRQLQSSDVRLVLGKDASQSLAAASESASMQLVGASGEE